MMNEGVESKTTTIRQSMSITKEDVLKWVAEKGAAEGASELKDMVHELSEALQGATRDVFKKHPECAAFFGVRGRVEIATSIDGKTEDALGYLGFGPGCNMEYVEELERWSKEKSEKCKKNCDNTPHSLSKTSLGMLKTLMELKEAMDKIGEDDSDSDSDSDKEDEE